MARDRAKYNAYHRAYHRQYQVAMYLPPRDHDRVLKLAASCGMSVSAYLKRLLMQALGGSDE
jgi:hypothetical protein